MHSSRQYLADLFKQEIEAREMQRATKDALTAAQRRVMTQRVAVREAEEALEKAREDDPDELIAAAREGRDPTLGKTSDQRHALASARDELEAAERVVVALRSRVPDADFRLGLAKGAARQEAGRALQSSPEWGAFIEDMRAHEKALATAYTVIRDLGECGLPTEIEVEFQSRYNARHTGHVRLRETADPNVIAAWRNAWAAMQVDAEAALPGMASAPESVTPRKKRGIFAVT